MKILDKEPMDCLNIYLPHRGRNRLCIVIRNEGEMPAECCLTLEEVEELYLILGKHVRTMKSNKEVAE